MIRNQKQITFMEINEDLLKIEKSKFKIILGILSLFIAILWILIQIVDNGTIGIFDSIYSIVFFLNGIVNIIEGRGNSSSMLFGKAYILINDENILLKKTIFDKEKKVCWKEIVSIKWMSNNFVFDTANEKSLTINMSKFHYSLVRKINETVENIAKEKNIKINNS